MRMQLAGKRILVLGLGVSGLSMARWLRRCGAQVRAADSRPTPPGAESLRRELPEVPLITGDFHPRLLEGVDWVAISPGLPSDSPLVETARRHGLGVAGDVELFAQALVREPPAAVLAITGSNGKSTVTEMVGAMARQAGLRTQVAGNIGLPVLDALAAWQDRGAARPELWVLELSSFQLETTGSLASDAATVLNVSEDHLDRYAGMAEYAAAKARIFQGCGVQVLNRDDAFSRAMGLPGRRVLTFGGDPPRGEGAWGLAPGPGGAWLAEGSQLLMPVRELPLVGAHNALNALAALALCRAVDLPYAPLLAALRGFRGLPHRLELVAEIGGVAFYDDSKGTNVGATAAALSGMTVPVVLIAGGDGKGQDFAPLKTPIATHARAVVLIGRDREHLAAALAESGVPLHRADSLETAVRQGFRLARPGDAVVLSPACASFDMFRDYRHRAEVFVAAVRELQGEQRHAV